MHVRWNPLRPRSLPRSLALGRLLTTLLLAGAVAVSGCESADADRCPGWLEPCGDLCVDRLHHPEHCGGCGIACETGERCVEGQCTGHCETVEVSSASELTALLGALPWSEVDSAASGALPVTCDVRVHGTVTVDASAIVTGGPCPGNDLCRPYAGFVDRGAEAGVTLEDLGDTGPMNDAERLTVTDATLRFRAVIHDVHPGYPPLIPQLEVHPPEAVPCPADRFSCGVDRICYTTASEYCRRCLGLASGVCACFDAEGFRPNGAVCTLRTSADTLCEGTCAQSACQCRW